MPKLPVWALVRRPPLLLLEAPPQIVHEQLEHERRLRRLHLLLHRPQLEQVEALLHRVRLPQQPLGHALKALVELRVLLVARLELAVLEHVEGRQSPQKVRAVRELACRELRGLREQTVLSGHVIEKE